MDHQHPLAAWRESQNPKVTQGALAEQVGVTRLHITFIEARRRRPSIDLAERIRTVTAGRVDLPQLFPIDEVSASECAA